MKKKDIVEISKPIIEEEEIEAVVDVLKSGYLSQGLKVKELENKFADYCGAKHAIAVNSGTATLHCALYAFGVEEGDEVITTPFTFVATANSILMQRARPVFVDIEEETFNIDPEKIEDKITKKTKAILPVDLFGHPHDVSAINRIATENNLRVLDDAAQSVAAEYKGKKVGTLSDATSFSLYATKNLTAGVGGIVTTNSDEVMKKCRLFRHHGQDESKMYEYLEFGYNYRMMDMIAVIAIEQLEKIEKFTKLRRENAKYLSDRLKKVEGIVLPKEKPGYKHVYHQYTIRIKDDYPLTREELISELEKEGIHSKIFYPEPLHLFPHISKFGYKKGDFPVAEKLSKEVLSLPVHPLVTEEELDRMVSVIKNS